MKVLLASSLMQCFNVLLALLISDMATPPKWVILNKVLVRSGPSLVTLKKSGPARVPCQIRGGLAWEDEMNALGYPLLHQWTIPSFSYRTSTHPRLEQPKKI